MEGTNPVSTEPKDATLHGLKKETYEVMAACGNCGSLKDIDLEKGVTVDSYRGKTRCDVCGCFMLPGGKQG